MRFARRLPSSRLAAPLALTAIALFVSFWQRPHEIYTDTRIELLTDPWLFLERVSQLWTSTIDLGHIQSSQFVGYLFPMGSFFALGDTLGLPTWVVQRLWIAALLAIAAWGTVRLTDRLLPSRGTLAGFVAGFIYLSSPFVVVSLNRGTSWLLPHAALPWLLLWTHTGMARPKSWRAPIVIALLLLLPGGGLNLPLLAWLLIAMAMLATFEAATRTGWRALLQFAWRTSLCGLVASLWWLVPVLAQVRFGADYLTFTEHAEAILHTPSASESLRLLGYWVVYTNGWPDITPQVPAMGHYLLGTVTIVATFAIPLLAVVALARLRTMRYASFFGLLLAVAVVAMSTGFPPTNFLGRAVTTAYYNAGPLVFMRTTYKAAPLAGLAIACLSGVGIAYGWSVLRDMRIRVGRRAIPSWLPKAGTVLVLVVLLGSWGRPLWSGSAADPRLFIEEVPPAWTAAIKDAQTDTPPGTRIAVLPGELFASYRWGNAQNSIVPALSRRPVIIRQITRPAPTNAAQLLDSTDNAIQQGRLMPGQLPPLLQLMGVGRVLVGTDQFPNRNQALDPARTAAELAQQPGFAKPVATYGPTSLFTPPAGRDGPAQRLPQVRAYAAPVPPEPGIIRAHSAAQPSIVDGDAEGVVSMAAVGALDPRRAMFYAGDLDQGEAARLVADRARLVFTDSNRRRPVLTSQLRVNIGATLGPHDPLPREFPDYDPFPTAGPAGRTVARYTGLRSLWSPLITSFTILPEHRPYAAFDGRLNTSWIAQARDPADRYVQLVLARPREIGTILVRGHRDAAGRTTGLGVRVNGGAERVFVLKPGWNPIPVRAGAVRVLRLRAIAQRNTFSPAGLDEVRIPGLPIRESLQLPSNLATLTKDQDLRRNAMSVILERTTADFPRHAGKPTRAAFIQDPVDQSDAEPGIRRRVTLPAARTFTAGGWAAVRPEAGDERLDRLVGLRSPSTFTSSSRLEGVPRYRASSAFDGMADTSWMAEFDGFRLPWVQWRGPTAIPIRSFRLVAAAGRHLRPTRLSVTTPQGSFALPIRSGGIVRLPATVRTNSLRITVTGVKRLPQGQRDAPRSVGFAEIVIPGLAPVHPRRTGSFTSTCGSLRLSTPGQRVALRVQGTVAGLDAGNAMAIATCRSTDAGLRLRAGVNPVITHPGRTFAPDYVRLDGPAPVPTVPTGQHARADADGNVHLVGPGWLVLGESFSPGWRAWCRAASGSERGLGAPQEIDGFANGWRIDGAECTHARFAFAPQTAADIAYWISGVGVLALIGALVVGSVRRRRRRHGETPADAPAVITAPVVPRSLLDVVAGGRSLVAIVGATTRPDTAGHDAVDRVRCLGWWAAIVLALGFGVLGAVVAGWPAAILTAAAVLALARLGISAGRLYAIAGFGILVVAVLYVRNPESVEQGINFDFSQHHLLAHWFALAAMLCVLAGGLIRVMDLARRRPRAGKDGPPVSGR